MLELKNLSFSVNDGNKTKQILKDINLVIDDKKFTVPLLINNMNSGMLQDLGAKYSAIAISIVPIILVYCLISKRLTSGMMAGAIKS